MATTVSARKPAVEPILGVSIEEYKEVSPKDAKGYDFSRVPNSHADQPKKRIHSQKQLTKGSAVDTQKTESWVLLLFILLPIAASGITFFRLKQPSINEEQPSGLKLVKDDQGDSDHDDIDYPKAS